ncbi:hypothetical protein FB451DRAFT_1175279 [Mycena latifolia]|nr:hypothetical protein FB451DRAFT_1175279 [Mycena latifolia]
MHWRSSELNSTGECSLNEPWEGARQWRVTASFSPDPSRSVTPCRRTAQALDQLGSRAGMLYFTGPGSTRFDQGCGTGDKTLGEDPFVRGAALSALLSIADSPAGAEAVVTANVQDRLIEIGPGPGNGSAIWSANLRKAHLLQQLWCTSSCATAWRLSYSYKSSYSSGDAESLHLFDAFCSIASSPGDRAVHRTVYGIRPYSAGWDTGGIPAEPVPYSPNLERCTVRYRITAVYGYKVAPPGNMIQELYKRHPQATRQGSQQFAERAGNHQGELSAPDPKPDPQDGRCKTRFGSIPKRLPPVTATKPYKAVCKPYTAQPVRLCTAANRPATVPTNRLELDLTKIISTRVSLYLIRIRMEALGPGRVDGIPGIPGSVDIRTAEPADDVLMTLPNWPDGTAAVIVVKGAKCITKGLISRVNSDQQLACQLLGKWAGHLFMKAAVDPEHLPQIIDKVLLGDEESEVRESAEKAMRALTNHLEGSQEMMG